MPIYREVSEMRMPVCQLSLSKYWLWNYVVFTHGEHDICHLSGSRVLINMTACQWLWVPDNKNKNRRSRPWLLARRNTRLRGGWRIWKWRWMCYIMSSKQIFLTFVICWRRCSFPLSVWLYEWNRITSIDWTNGCHWFLLIGYLDTRNLTICCLTPICTFRIPQTSRCVQGLFIILSFNVFVNHYVLDS